MTTRRLTPAEYSTAWHAVEGAAGEPGTVLDVVLDALGITPPAPDALAAAATPGTDNGGAL